MSKSAEKSTRLFWVMWEFRKKNKMCDVDFLLGKSGQLIKAHKIILACSSKVFESMFDGPLKEQKKAVRIPNIDITSFTEVLR